MLLFHICVGKRVLCTGGALCMYGYELPKFRSIQDPSKNSWLDAALGEVNKYLYDII